ncbi:acyl-CoA thioesterase [Leptolyngbya sp. FACHB-17]|uniref:acyl-CoA thioesterase n=1 Tax=unclassified Leptolyngbya TaxID=2650499 RepID=UPI0016812614|nr:acyl-CoA thioesterase [Leptolyngbya sp. FACHB-17]MBD2081178.1 acyl-CoA thioesterase [Leptolyngbya sp. FACHB-17]
MSQSIVYSEEREVQSQHCDVQNHLNNVVYVQWIQDIAIAAYRSKGYSRKFDKNNHIIWFVRRHEIDYLSPAFVGDVVRLTTWVEGGTLSTFFRRVEFVRVSDQKALCRSLTEWCYFDAKRNRPAKIPSEIKAVFLTDY